MSHYTTGYGTCPHCGEFEVGEDGVCHNCGFGAPNTKESNPKDSAALTRLDMSLFPASARIMGALALTEGDLKYGGYNWRVAGVKASVYIAACARHLEKYWNGEDVDPVTQVPHLANALASLAVIIDALHQGKLEDDRPPKQDVGVMLNECERIIKHLQSLFPVASKPKRYTEK